MARQARVKPFASSVFIGLPWPMKRAGIVIGASIMSARRGRRQRVAA
jgi:hypothetical protein